MPRIEAATQIDAPPEEVYGYVAEARRRPQWLSELTVLEAPDRPLREGDHIKGQTTVLGQQFVGRAVVDEEAAPRRLSEEVIVGVRLMSRWSLDPSDAGTTITHSIEVDLPSGLIGRPVGWLLALWLRRVQRRSLQNLRRLFPGPTAGR